MRLPKSSTCGMICQTTIGNQQYSSHDMMQNAQVNSGHPKRRLIQGYQVQKGRQESVFTAISPLPFLQTVWKFISIYYGCSNDKMCMVLVTLVSNIFYFDHYMIIVVLLKLMFVNKYP